MSTSAQVLDPAPLSGLSVSPLHGCVPAGGSAELSLTLASKEVTKFDALVLVAVRTPTGMTTKAPLFVHVLGEVV